MRFYVSLNGFLRNALFAGAPDYLRDHQGKALRLCVGPLRLVLRIDAAGRVEMVHREVWADAQVTVPAARLCGDRKAPLQLEGDSDLLRDFAALVDNGDIGFAALAERMFGTQVGGMAENAMHAATSYGQDACERLSEQCADWLTRESGILPEPAKSRQLGEQVHNFAVRVEALRAQVAPVREG